MIPVVLELMTFVCFYGLWILETKDDPRRIDKMML